MKRILLLAFLLLLSTFTFAAPSGHQGTDQLIIKFKSQPKNLTASLQSQMGKQMTEEMKNKLKSNIGSDKELKAIIAKIKYKRAMSGDAHVLSLPTDIPYDLVYKIIKFIVQYVLDVEYVVPDIYVEAFAVTPNDPLFDQQWHYMTPNESQGGANITEAWEITKGSDNVIMAVLDTGITDHSEFEGRLVQGYDMISSSSNSNDGDGRDDDPSDDGDWCRFYPSSWHGTHVAGTMAANTDNGNGVAGINWEGKLQIVRVLGACGGANSDIIDGIRWAAGLTVPGTTTNANPAQVINMSLGGGSSCDAASQSAIDDAVAAGTTVVVAAGNSNDDTAGYSPASCDGVITVASVGPDGDRAPYSNYSTSVVEIAAPGGDTSTGEEDGILSTLNDGSTVPGNETYAYYQGTSMASPHVAGIVGLLYAVKSDITPAQVSQVIQDTARPFAANTECAQLGCGAGIIDAKAAVEAAMNLGNDNSGGDDDDDDDDDNDNPPAEECPFASPIMCRRFGY